MNKKAVIATLLSIVATVALSTASAEKRKGPPGGKPPAAAIEACASASEADSCSYDAKDGNDVSGSCKAAPRGDGPLACVPAGGPS